MGNRFKFTLFTGAFAVLAALAAFSTARAAQHVGIIVLTQTACQFIESEDGIERGYTTTKKADCDAINGKNGAERVAAAEPLVLKPGSYIFRVTNRDVPYVLGFWLRAEKLIDRIYLPSVSGGGLETGDTRDYVIELTPGNYVYSCPLNTTPDYRLIVQG
ncbi:MAG: hypothetical protein ACC663_04670 [Gammaproteobacteria bacterium]